MAVRNRAVVNEHLVTERCALQSLRSPPRGASPQNVNVSMGMGMGMGKRMMYANDNADANYKGMVPPPPPHCQQLGYNTNNNNNSSSNSSNSGHGGGGPFTLTEEQWGVREAELTQQLHQQHTRVVDKLQRELAIQNLTIAKLQQQVRAAAAAAEGGGGGGGAGGAQQAQDDDKMSKVAAGLLAMPELRDALFRTMRGL